MNMRTRRSGFSLIELIVVIAIAGVVTTIGMAIFSRMWTDWSIVRTRAELDQRAVYALDQIRKDMSAVLSPALSGSPLRGARGEAEGAANDELVVPVQVPLADASQMQSGTVRYAVERKGGSPVLNRYQGALSGPGATDPATKIAEDVTQLRVEFLPRGGQSDWQPEWRETRLPAMVRVSVTVSLPGRPIDAVTRVAVFRVPVNG